MSRPVVNVALDLCQDLEILTCLLEDLAQRTAAPEGRALAKKLSALQMEWCLVAEELEASTPPWRLVKMHPTRVVLLHGRAGELAGLLAAERQTALLMAEKAGSYPAYTRTLLRNLDLTHNRIEALQKILSTMPVHEVKPGLIFRVDSELAGDLAANSELHEADEWEPTETAVRPGRHALRLVELVVRVLPPDQRARYGEEFRAELFGLAETSRRPGAQLLYVVKQFNRAFELRYELRRPAHRSVQP